MAADRDGEEVVTGGQKAHSLRRHLIVLAAYVALTAIMTWPIAGTLGTHIPGHEGDAWVHLWTFDWIKTALLAGRSPFFTDQLFYPGGASLVFHNIAWLHFALWLPLQALVGGSAAYSLVFMANFAFNAWATYLLALDVTRRGAPAFVAGLIAGFWPYTMSHHSHPNLITIGWLALMLLALRRLLARRGRREALLLGVVVALTGITRWQLVMILAPGVAIYLLYELATRRSSRDRRMLGLLALAGLVALLLVLPLASPLIVAQVNRTYPEDIFVESGGDSTDVLAYVVPSRYQPLWGERVFEAGYEPFIINKVFTPFLGYTVLLLAALGLIWRRLNRGRAGAVVWLLMVVFYMGMAIGPAVTVNGVERATVPYASIYDSFYMGLIRYPDRFNVALAVPMALLAALGLAALMERIQNRRVASAAAAALGFLVLFEFIAVYPLLPMRVPAWYEEVAADPEAYALVDIPMHARSYDENYMLYQMSHGRPMVGGHISRAPREAFDFIESVPMLAAVRGGELWPPELPDVSRQLALLHEADIRYLIVHKKYMTNEQETAWDRWLGRAPVHEGEDLIVYETAPRAISGEDAVVQLSTAGDLPLIITQAHVSPSQPAPGGFVWVDVHWGSLAAPGEAYEMCVALEGEAGAVAEACQALAPGWPSSQWQANELAATNTVLPVDPFVATGDYVVDVTLRNAEGRVVGQANLGQVSIEALERQFELEGQPAFPLEATWRDGEQPVLTLRGYDLEQGREQLALTFTWQALRRPQQSYKLFVHVREEDTGQVVAQQDLIPRDWTYPTNWWEEGEVVVDRVQLSLAGVAPGRYELFAGWYDQETLQRLAVSSEEGSGDALLITSIMVAP